MPYRTIDFYSITELEYNWIIVRIVTILDKTDQHAAHTLRLTLTLNLQLKLKRVQTFTND